MSKKLIEQKDEIVLKYKKNMLKGNFILAAYWQRKLKKIANIEREVSALTKRQLANQEIKKLNTIKI